MSGASRYVLDANVFMDAARRYYAFDLVPRFWDALIDQAQNSRVLSIDRVKTEILRGKDTLAQWANDKFHKWFESTDQNDVTDAYREIIQWSGEHDQFSDFAKEEFAISADAWLVAYALAKGCTVVTHEIFDANIKRKIKIPNVCQQLDVEYINPFEMLRRLNIKL